MNRRVFILCRRTLVDIPPEQLMGRCKNKKGFREEAFYFIDWRNAIWRMPHCAFRG
jgi:hypothetical protein